MWFVRRPVLLSAAVMALTALGIKVLLGSWVVPRMIERGNALLVAEMVRPLENYFVDHQEWPAGTAEEINWRLQGAKNDVIGEKPAEGAPVPATPAIGVAGGSELDPAEAPSVRRQRLLPSVNYVRDANVRPAGLTLGDAWGHPLEFNFIPGGPATVTSLGADAMLGTADDVMATAGIMPRKTEPTRAMFLADREFRRAEEARRLEHARRLAEKVK